MRWRRVDAAAAELDRVCGLLCRHPLAAPEAVAQLGELRLAEMRLGITRAIEALQEIEIRIGRPVICVGVVGTARSGKSTFVQAISGLTDAHVPIGPEAAATAVRCRFTHTIGRRRAVLTLHSFDSFRALHLMPRYLAAGLGEAPADIDAFREAEYAPEDVSAPATPLDELRMMRGALWSYETLLDRPGGVLELSGDELDRLPEYVAYPRAGSDLAAPRRYLAVREASIECAFPHADAGGIALVDLPGESAPPAPARQDCRPEQDIDALVLLTRPDALPPQDVTEVYPALWPLGRRLGEARDVAYVVLNTPRTRGRRRDGDAPPASSGPGEDRSGRVAVVDCADPVAVSGSVLRPMLRQLVGRLPRVDSEHVATVMAQLTPLRDELLDVAVRAQVVLRHSCGGRLEAVDTFYRRTDEAFRTVAAAAHQVHRRLRDQARGEAAEFRDAVDACHADVLAWIRQGFGLGSQRWRDLAKRSVGRDNGLDGYAASQLDQLRIDLADRYAVLDEYLHRRLRLMWTDITAALSLAWGPLLGGRTGPEGLFQLSLLAKEAAQPCPGLAEAITGLLAVRLDYRTHLHPRVRSALDSLATPGHAVDVGAGPGRLSDLDATELADGLFRMVSERAVRAAERVRVGLFRESALPGQILAAGVESFIDAVFRGETAAAEARIMSRSYQGDLATVTSLDLSDARVARVGRSADDLLSAAAECCARGV
jgi:hypothetical protein